MWLVYVSVIQESVPNETRKPCTWIKNVYMKRGPSRIKYQRYPRTSQPKIELSQSTSEIFAKHDGIGAWGVGVALSTLWNRNCKNGKIVDDIRKR